MSKSEQDVRDDLAAGERTEQLNWLFGLVALALALVVAALLANRLTKALVKPLEQLAWAARSLGDGHLDHRVSINSTAELNEVGGTFNAMAKALEAQRAELERHAFADTLTGLPNRALFEGRARDALARVAGTAQRVAVLVLDVDGFKLVNDGLGHASGDRLLVQAAERMSKWCVPRTRLRDSAATSTRCCSRTSAVSTTPSAPPSACARRSARPSC